MAFVDDFNDKITLFGSVRLLGNLFKGTKMNPCCVQARSLVHCVLYIASRND